MNINGINFTNLPDKALGTKISTVITQSNVGNKTTEQYLVDENFYKLYNAVDIDWNGAVIDAETEINDTADLIKVIIDLKAEIAELKNQLNKVEGTIETEFDTDENGDVQLINTDND